MSRLPGWACFAGLELMSDQRALSYMRACLGCSRVAVELAADFQTEMPCEYPVHHDLAYEGPCENDPVNLKCYCAVTSEVLYIDPAIDEAPWYTAARPESADFLGILPQSITLSAPSSREAFTRLDMGGSFSGEYLGSRVVEVVALMTAATTEGMAWGERWLNEALRGRLCAPDCQGDELRIALHCGAGRIVDGVDLTPLRTLVGTVLVDGPNFTPLGEDDDDCVIQEVQFQLASQMPWLYEDEILAVDDVSVAAGTEDCALIEIDDWNDGETLIVEIDAGSADKTGVVFTITPSLDGTCPETRLAGNCVRWTMDLPAAAVVTVDGTRRRATYFDPTEHRTRSALPLMDWEGAFPWPDLAACTSYCVCLDNPNGAGPVAYSVQRRRREL